jgi:endo-1,4-beta-xylanase
MGGMSQGDQHGWYWIKHQDRGHCKVWTTSSTPDGLERHAWEITMHYRTLFEDPNVEWITYWGFINGGWLKAPSGFVTADSKIKPSYEALHKLVKDEWWTKPMKLTTDDAGSVTVSGFLGEYEAECGGNVTHFTL